jgi:hypothetical protein
MSGFLKIINSIIILALTYAFIRWYVKGHFGKYFILFWANTIIAFIMFTHHKNNVPEYDHRTGAEVWESQY